jgi:hypothetical protein
VSWEFALPNSSRTRAGRHGIDEAHKVDYPIPMGDDGITKRYSVKALPLTYLIDTYGRVAGTYAGVMDRANIETNIKLLLAER